MKQQTPLRPLSEPAAARSATLDLALLGDVERERPARIGRRGRARECFEALPARRDDMVGCHVA